MSANFEETTRLAEQGDAEAQYELGKAYYYGENITQNYSKAVDLLQKSATQNNEYAQLLLADAYVRGNGVLINNSKAAELWQKLVDSRSTFIRNSALYYLGDTYYEGKGVEKNIDKAIELWEKAVGDSDAQRRLDMIKQQREQAYKKLENQIQCPHCNTVSERGVSVCRGCGAEVLYGRQYKSIGGRLLAGLFISPGIVLSLITSPFAIAVFLGEGNGTEDAAVYTFTFLLGIVLIAIGLTIFFRLGDPNNVVFSRKVDRR